MSNLPPMRKKAPSRPNIHATGDVEPRRLRTAEDEARVRKLFPPGRPLEEDVEDLKFSFMDLADHQITTDSRFLDYERKLTELAQKQAGDMEAFKGYARRNVSQLNEVVKGYRVPASLGSALVVYIIAIQQKLGFETAMGGSVGAAIAMFMVAAKLSEWHAKRVEKKEEKKDSWLP